MIDHELTDPTGSALTITHNIDGVWVTATDIRDEVTVGPFPARVLRASFDMGDDLMDGGVTAAAIENEVVSPEQARSLVQENDELRVRIGRVEEARDLYRRDALTEERLHGEAQRFALAWKETARHLFGAREVVRLACDLEAGRADRAEQERDDNVQSREEMIDRLFAALKQARADTAQPRPLGVDDIWRACKEYEKHDDMFEGMSAAIETALTEPQRPVGAEEVEVSLLDADEAGFLNLAPLQISDLADWMAERGVRVTGEQS